MLQLLIVVGRALALGLRGHRELVLENLALRQQLMAMKRANRRPRLQARDRLFWIALRRIWTNWRTAVVLIRPETVVDWHRTWLRRRWTPTLNTSSQRPSGRHCGNSHARRSDGQRESVVGSAPHPRRVADSRRRRLRTHRVASADTTDTSAIADVADLPDESLRVSRLDGLLHGVDAGRVLFVVVVLSHHRRRILHINTTAHPTAEWAAQQVVEAFPDDTAPHWIHRDRDRIYGAAFQRRLAGMGIAEVLSAPASPWQNPYVERVIGSIRRECLDHVLVLNESHLRRVLTSSLRYDHRSRTHLGLEKDTPDRRPVAETSIGPIIVVPEVGGLHHRYERRAA
jgi:putative transposase